MSVAHTATGLAALGIVVQFGFSAMPSPDFMRVDALEYRDGSVVFERTIYEPSVIADWSVVVTDGLATVCAGVGSAEYTPDEARQKNMPLSTFVGERCSLPPGEYTLYAYWHPRDARDRVKATTTFEVTE